MNVIFFDTHRAVMALKNSGFSDAQAEGIVEVFALMTNDLATKADIRELRGEFRSELQQLETRLTIRMGVMLFSGLTASTAILNFLIKAH